MRELCSMRLVTTHSFSTLAVSPFLSDGAHLIKAVNYIVARCGIIAEWVSKIVYKNIKIGLQVVISLQYLSDNTYNLRGKETDLTTPMPRK